ncbi:MAG: hypothetical protein IMF11_08945 [Proteobacteria bacterium]|nr:hypothetical protein [Pseudomonadota bacterium]
MNFNEFYDTVTEYEADYSTLLSAWSAGASTMLERIVSLGPFSEGLEEIIREEVKGLMEGK